MKMHIMHILYISRATVTLHNHVKLFLAKFGSRGACRMGLEPAYVRLFVCPFVHTFKHKFL